MKEDNGLPAAAKGNENFDKSGQFAKGSRAVCVGVSAPKGNSGKTSYMKSGRDKFAAQAASNWKVKPGKMSSGNAGKINYGKRGA